MKIAFFEAKPYDLEYFNAANAAFGFQISYFKERLTRETVSLVEEHDVVCVFVNNKVTGEIIDEICKRGVKLIALRSAGYNHVDLKAARGKIKVVYVPRYSPYSVAEFAVGMMLCLNRKIHHAYLRTKENNFTISGLMGFDMHGKTAGVVGCGKIGSVMVKILQGFGMQVIGYDIDRTLPEKAGCTFTDLDTLYKSSDIITLHCPLTTGNQHMINSHSLSQMKDGVMIINTGRGGVIDAAALIDALKSKKVGAAGLDVYEEESRYFYEDFSSSFISDDVLSRLQTFPNVLITSHQAFFTQEAMSNIAQTTLQNIQAFAKKEPLENEVI